MSKLRREIAWIGADNYLRVGAPIDDNDTSATNPTLGGLRNGITGAYLNDLSTVFVDTLKDSDGVEVTGQAWPTQAFYVADSNGEYRALLSKDLAVTAGIYTAYVSADGGAGLYMEWEIEIEFKVRTY